jgi:hypothetical protein
MFTYEQQNGKPMGFEEGASPKIEETIEVENKVVFIHDYHGKYEGILVIGVFNKDAHTYERFVSSVELQLKDHELKDRLDLYEFAPLNHE